jgi:CheY-like chemotaxis protein
MANKKAPYETLPIDLASVMERVGGDESFLNQLIEIYIEDFFVKYEQLKKAVKENDYKAIETIGHSLKGSSGNLSLNGLYETSSEIELSAREKDIEQTKIFLGELIKEFGILQEFLPRLTVNKKSISLTHHSDAQKNPQIKILAADDSLPNQILLQVCAAHSGFHMDIANNGKEAFELFKKNTYSIIFLDIHMPEIDGFEALNLIRKYEYENVLPNTPIVALTGSTFQEKGAMCLDAGFDDFIEKSSFHSVLKETINKHVRKADIGKEKIVLDETLLPLIPEYLQSRKEDLEKIKEALENRDYNKIEDLGHKMKGSGKCYGFEMISTLGHRIELSARERKPSEIEKSIGQMKDYLLNLNYE